MVWVSYYMASREIIPRTKEGSHYERRALPDDWFPRSGGGGVVVGVTARRRDPPPAQPRPVHGRPRRLDPEHRPAVDQARPPLQPAEPAMGRQRLHPHLRRLPAARRASGRPPWSPPRSRHRPDRVRRLVAGWRSGRSEEHTSELQSPDHLV